MDFDETIHKNHIIVSFKGVTKVDFDQSTLVSHEDWIKEVDLFHNISKLNFFKNFNKNKIFRMWNLKTVNKFKIKNKENLMKNNFFFQPDLNRSI